MSKKLTFYVVMLCALKRDLCHENDGTVFVATNEWQEIHDGQKVPAGLHYRINLETGRKEAKLLSDDEAKVSEETAAILSDSNRVQEPEGLTDEKINAIREKMKKIKFNRDVEHIQVLVETFGNSSYEKKKSVLKDLDFYLHQIDNANDFVFLDGFNQVIYPALNSQDEDLIDGATILLGSAAQSNTEVQESAQKAGLLSRVLELLDQWSSRSEKLVSRFVFALSALVRDNNGNLQKFQELKGSQKLLTVVDSSAGHQNTIKILTFLSDISKMPSGLAMFSDDAWCIHLVSQGLILKMTSLDNIEKYIHCLANLKAICFDQILKSDHLSPWLAAAKLTLREHQDTDTDFSETLAELDSLSNIFNETKTEL